MKPAFHVGEVTSLEETKPIAQSENFNIFYNYPNPFNSSTQFIFNTDKKNSKEVEIIIYDILGRAMKQINPGHLTTGLNKIIWDGTDNSGNQVATGMYIAKLKGGDTVRFKKLLLIR